MRTTQEELEGFIQDRVEPGSTVYKHLCIRQKGQASDQNQGGPNVAWEQKETAGYLVAVETLG